MPTERKRAIRTAAAWNADQTAMEALYGVGGYYTSLSLWEAGEQANLTTLDEIRTAVCYNDWPSGLADELDINGWTTDATRYVRVTVAEGHRHNGTPKSGFHMQKTSTTSTLVFVRHGYTVLEWIDAEQLGASGKFGIRHLAGAQPVFRKCISKNNTAANAAFSSDVNSGALATLIQCLAYDTPYGFGSSVSTAFAALYNCVAANCSNHGFHVAGGAVITKNCVAYNCGTGYRTVGFSDANSSNNATSAVLGTYLPGANGVSGVTAADFANAASNDFHLSAGSVLRGAGVNLYSDFQTDIDGDTWPSSGAWDIGFDYYVAAGGGQDLAATGAATATGTATPFASVALAGVGVALATGTATATGSAPLTAIGAATASGSATPAVQIALSALGLAVASGTAALSGAASGELAAGGQASAQGAAAMVANVTVGASGLAQAAASAGLSAAVLLAGAGAAAASGNATLAAELHLLAAGAAQASGSATITGLAGGQLAAGGQAQALGSAALVLDVRLQAAGAATATGSATLDSGSAQAIAASGGAQAAGTGQISAQVVLTGAGFVQAMGAGYLVVQVDLAAAGAAQAGGSATAVDADALALIESALWAVDAPGRRWVVTA